jgi:RNA polymerase sigma factor (sigma-70 family)
MPQTSATLLERLQTPGDEAAWERFLVIYKPLIHGWLRRFDLAGADADDLAQDVLMAVVKDLPEFQHAGQKGAFRGWLRVVTLNRLRGHWRRLQTQRRAAGSQVAEMLDQLQDPASELCRRWDQEHDRFVTQRLLEIIQPEFQATTWQAFRRLVLEDAAPAQVAQELGLSSNAVWSAKSRVLRRLRQEAQGLVETI